MSKIPAGYERRLEEVNEWRVARVREALEGRSQARAAELLGMSREGLRRLLNPKARAAAAEQERARRARVAGSGHSQSPTRVDNGPHV